MGTLDFDLKGVVALAEEAGRATLTCYQKPLEIRYKGDESPVSQADELSHQIIAKGLADTGLQVVSEEGETQSKATRYWCVDPLDGTKSYIAGVEDFSVNIALIVEGRPVWGVVVAPVLEGAGEPMDEYQRRLTVAPLLVVDLPPVDSEESQFILQTRARPGYGESAGNSSPTGPGYNCYKLDAARSHGDT